MYIMYLEWEYKDCDIYFLVTAESIYPKKSTK